jgi:hypothetical protein
VDVANASFGATNRKRKPSKVVARNTTWKKEERIRQKRTFRIKFLSILARFEQDKLY